MRTSLSALDKPALSLVLPVSELPRRLLLPLLLLLLLLNPSPSVKMSFRTNMVVGKCGGDYLTVQFSKRKEVSTNKFFFPSGSSRVQPPSSSPGRAKGSDEGCFDRFFRNPVSGCRNTHFPPDSQTFANGCLVSNSLFLPFF